MFDRYVAQLQDADPAKRREAIIALGKLADPAAMPALAQVYRTDPDPSLRDLARQAGLNIRKKQTQSTESVPPTATSEVSAAPASPPPPPAEMDYDMPSFDDIVSAAPPKSAKPATPAPASSSPFTQPLDDPDEEDSLLAALGGATAAAATVSKSPAYYEDPPELYADEPSTLIYDEPPLYDENPAPASRTVDLSPSTDTSSIQSLSTKGPVRGREYNVPREDRERASRNLESALTVFMRGDKAKAMKLLTEALSLNPNLINDNYFNSVAANVTGLDGDGAIQMIVDAGQRSEFVKTASKQAKTERVDKHLSTIEESTWGAVGYEVVIYGLIVTVGPLLFFLILTQFLQGVLTNLSGDPEFAAALPPELTNFTGINFGILFLICLIAGGSSILGVLLQGGVTHLLATGIFGGKGTFTHMMTLVLRAYNRLLPFLFLLLYVFIAVLFVAAGSIVVLCIALPTAIFSFYILFQVINRVGEAYDFGLAFGCLSYMIAGVIIGILSTLLTNALTQALVNQFANRLAS
jgi:hypothetical protein